MYKEDIKLHYDIKHEPREIQVEALAFTKNQIRRGKKFIMLNMPTGSGKSLFSMMFVNWYLNYVNKDAKFDILTNSKILQNQYVAEFPFMSSLKGKNAYKCNEYPDTSCQEGKELNAALKRTCNDCPYDKARAGWMTNQIALTNFHLFNSVNLFVPQLMIEKNPNVLIIDEAHDFESVLCDFISSKISRHSLKILGFNDVNIGAIFGDIKTIKYMDDFVDYIENAFIERLEQQIKSLEKGLGNSSLGMKDKVKYSKNIINVRAAIGNYKNFLEDYKINPNNWILDVEKTEDKSFYKNLLIQPVWSHKYLKETVWDKYDHVLFMSATILDKTQFCYMNGIETNLSSYYEVESPFHVKNRPIYYIKGVGKNTFTEKEKTWENQKLWVEKIVKKYKDKKGIIHCGSYEFSRWMEEYFKDNPRFIFHTSETRDDALRQHIESKEPTIIVSPSMITGVDLKDDLSRFQIIMKIPYPNLGSAKIKKRLNDNKEWYGMKTCADLIQACGRSVRNEKDNSSTFILDDSFSAIMKYNYKFLPNWFTESVKIIK